MAQNTTLTLDTFVEEEEYRLIAIHCPAEAYKLAFNLNLQLNLKLAREKCDVDFKHKERGTAYYQLFKFQDQALSCHYYLFSNKFRATPENLQSHGALFQARGSYTTHLIAEYKNVDFFLKIEDLCGLADTAEIITKINGIKPVVAAYEVDRSTLKSNENLIFS